MLLLLPVNDAMSQACTAVDTFRARGGVLAVIRNPGNYCLHSNLEQPVKFDIHAMTTKSTGGAPLLEIRCAGGNASCRKLSHTDLVNIDLQSHTLEAESKDMVGISGRGWRGGVVIRNGTVRVPGSRGTNFGIDLRGDVEPLVLLNGTRCSLLDQPCGGTPRPKGSDKPPTYQVAGYLIEKVNVHAGTQGVRLIGHGNVVRSSVIEVDGWNGIALYGKQALVEGNTIIVHAKREKPRFAAAITLRDAEGSVLRNNRFIFKGRSGQAPPAIRLIDSANVRLEGNTFEGFIQVVEQTGKSSYNEKK